MNNQLGNISRDLILLLKESNAWDKRKHYIYFDRVWQVPTYLRKCANLIYTYIQVLDSEQSLLPDDKSQIIILSPDSVDGNLGVIPISFVVAEKLGCAIAVWKELADIRWGTSAIIGKQETDLYCIVLQDVVDQGTTAIKIAQSIKELRWKFILYLAVVLNNNRGEEDVRRTLTKVKEILGTEPNFKKIVSVSDLG